MIADPGVLRVGLLAEGMLLLIADARVAVYPGRIRAV